MAHKTLENQTRRKNNSVEIRKISLFLKWIRVNSKVKTQV